MGIFTAVKAFSSELVACCASLFKRGEADRKRGIGMIMAKTTLFVSRIVMMCSSSFYSAFQCHASSSFNFFS